VIEFLGEWLATLFPLAPERTSSWCGSMLEVAPVSAARGGPNGSNTAGKDPGIGAIAGDPAYVAVPHASSVGLRPGYFGGSYLGTKTKPFQGVADPSVGHFKVRNLHLAAAITLGQPIPCR
jgi:hypothetical protein